MPTVEAREITVLENSSLVLPEVVTSGRHFVVLEAPKHGALQFWTDPSAVAPFPNYVYVPDVNYVGTDQFTLGDPFFGPSLEIDHAYGVLVTPTPGSPAARLAIAGGGAQFEGNGETTTFSFTVERTGDTSQQTQVDYFTWGHADVSDFGGAIAGTLSFAPGETTKTIAVAATGDTAVEPDEAFHVSLSNPRGGAIDSGTAHALIQNDDRPTPPGPTTLAISSEGSSFEGLADLTPFKLTVTRSGDSSAPTLVDYFTWGDADSQDLSGRTAGALYFAPGEISKTITINVYGDPFEEPNEAFHVSLSNPRGGVIGTGTADAVIINDDAGSPGHPPPGARSTVQFGTEFIAKTEGDSGQTAFTFEITRRGLLTEEVTVDVRAEGSGAHPTDAADANLVPFSQLTFARDETSKIYTVLVNRDTLQEPDETFTLTLAPAPFSFPQIANGTATGVILNDDAPPPPSGGSGQVYTSAGAETITGASGDDTINASRGFDVLTGAGGADQFVFGAEPWAPIEITDFTPGADKLDFRLIFDTLGYSGSDPFGDGYISLVDDGAGGAVVLFDRDLSGPDPEWPTYIVHLKDVVAAHLGLGDWIVQ